MVTSSRDVNVQVSAEENVLHSKYHYLD